VPVRVNSGAGSVNRIQIDEMRPSIDTGPGERVAVAWTDTSFDIQVSISSDGGRSFPPSVRLNRDDTADILQEFPAIAFDADGRLHAVWLDPRVAGRGLEEPADLYYTLVDADGRPGLEENLTADQDSSVCGCCLPDIRVSADGTVEITFRNTTEDGYRDPFRITGRAGAFPSPRRLSPPVWRIDACPVAGPIGVGDGVLWLDASTGQRRLLSSYNAETEPEVVLSDGAGGNLRFPPRLVEGLPGETPVVLVPMTGHSRLIVPEGLSWRVAAADLPEWVTSAALHVGRLLMTGTEGGFRIESRAFDIGG
jgi:hypothetical protein